MDGVFYDRLMMVKGEAHPLMILTRGFADRHIPDGVPTSHVVRTRTTVMRARAELSRVLKTSDMNLSEYLRAKNELMAAYLRYEGYRVLAPRQDPPLPPLPAL